MKNHTLTPMQSFFLERINAESRELNPGYLANMYYESIGKRRYVASRDSFGQTSAAYRTCRRLAELGLIREVNRFTGSGYSYPMYCRLPEPPKEATP